MLIGLWVLYIKDCNFKEDRISTERDMFQQTFYKQKYRNEQECAEVNDEGSSNNNQRL